MEDIKEAAGIEHVTGDAIVEFPDDYSLFLTPRYVLQAFCLWRSLVYYALVS